MKDRAKIQCNHSVKRAEKNQFEYFYQLVTSDEFPAFQPGICTEKCKEKMKKIIDLTLVKYENQAKDYFDYCKIHFNRNEKIGIGPWMYMLNFRDNDYDEQMQLYTNVQFINGKIVRFSDVSNNNNQNDSDEQQQLQHEEESQENDDDDDDD